MKLRRLLEMAREPKTARKAERLAAVLPPNTKAAKEAAAKFWDEFLGTKFGWRTEEAPRVVDQVIEVKKGRTQSGEEIPFLLWHAVVTFLPRKTFPMSMFITTVDEPGAYRIDYVVPGMKKSITTKVREELTNHIMRSQDRMTMVLDADELAEFHRLRTSMKPMPHTHKEGMRDDKHLVARLVFDNIPMDRLHEKAAELVGLTRHIGDTAAKAYFDDQRAKSSTKP
jgi:hypothetical protein